MTIIHQQCIDRIYFCLFLEDGVSFPIRKTRNLYQGSNFWRGEYKRFFVIIVKVVVSGKCANT